MYIQIYTYVCISIYICIQNSKYILFIHIYIYKCHNLVYEAVALPADRAAADERGARDERARERFCKVNSPTEPSTYYILLLIKTIS